MLPRGPDRAGKLLQAQAAGARVVAVEGGFDDALRGRPRAGRGRPSAGAPGHPRELGQPIPPRGPEDRRVRGLRGPRRCARLPGHPGRQRRQHHRLLEGLHGVPRGRPGRDDARRMLGFQAEGAAPLVLGHRRGRAADGGHGDPHRRPRERRRGAARARRVGRPHRGRHRRGDPRRLPRPGALRGHLLRAGQRRVGGGRAQSSPPTVASTRARRSSRADGPRTQGPRHRRDAGGAGPRGGADRRGRAARLGW